MAPLIFTVSRQGRVLIAALNRDVGNFAEAEIIRETKRLIDQARSAPVPGVVVDFEHAEYFGSTMLEALRLLWTHLRQTNTRLVLCRVSEVGREILEVAHFDTVWPICATREEAVEVASGEKAGDGVME
jgi:anti-anti-sigma regulatory factor